jgi:octaprenyl-diphosphate synthase
MAATVVELRAERPRASLEPLLRLVAPGMAAVNRVIEERMQSPVALIPELAGHLISGGGKRLRPMLTLACADALDYRGDRHHKLAAAVEFIHTATLLHDDVVDGSDLRRGRAAANVIWGNGPSVLVGDFLFSRAFELMVEVGSLPVLRLLSHASAVIAEGEVAQTTAQRVVETTEDRYLEIISAKTAALFAAAAQIAAVVADADPATEEALGAFGRNLGIAFQLVDDAIDYVSDSAVMGKTAGDDFREGKVTLPIILAYARGDAEARRFWRRAVTGRANGADALAEAVGRLNATGAIADTLARARLYGSRATDALALMPPSAAAAALTETVEFAVSRAY